MFEYLEGSYNIAGIYPHCMFQSPNDYEINYQHVSINQQKSDTNQVTIYVRLSIALQFFIIHRTSNI